MKITKKQFFQRQITLQEIGEKGQEKLQNARVLVVGCGGLGSPIAVYLAQSGVGNLHLVDFDVISVSNLHRQVFYTLEDIGKYKSAVLANFIQQRTPFTKVTFDKNPIQKKSVLELVNQFDIIVDGTDSLPTKYLLNDACVLQNKPLVYGSLYKFDGYVATLNVPQNNNEYSCNLRDAFPEMATDVPNCEEAGTLNPIVGIIALLQANEVIKLITGIGKPLINQLLIYNALQNSQLKMSLQSLDKNHTERKQRIAKIFKKEAYFDASCEYQYPDWLITSEALKKVIAFKKPKNILIISLINKDKNHPFYVDEYLDILTIEDYKINPEKEYIFVCQKGITSYKAVKFLKEKYPHIKMLSLVGGVSNY